MEFIADFETTSVRVYEEIKKTVNTPEGRKTIKEKRLDRKRSKAFVCAWAIIPEELEPDASHIVRGRTIEGFMTYVEQLYFDNKKTTKSGKGKPQKINVYTHNLKFDGDFILYYILKNKIAEVVSEVRENVLYNFKIRFPSGAEIAFYDSLKIFPMKAEKIGKLYGIEKLKGEWDYKKYRDATTEISPEEWAYVDHDVMIVSRALADYRARGYMENTQAAIAYNERLKRTWPWFHKLPVLRLKKGDFSVYRDKFPKEIKPLPVRQHKHLLMGYFGGISYVNPKYANKDIIGAYSYDVNSMYPAQMHDAMLPFGDPNIIENPSLKYALHCLRTWPCVVADIDDLSITLKSERHLPFLMFPTNSQTSVRMQGKVISCRHEKAVLSCQDFRIMESEYNIHTMKIKRLYCFNSKRGQYAAFVDYFYGMKSDADEVRNDPNASAADKMQAEIIRNVAKVMINASYGKDGTKLLRTTNKTVYNPAENVLENRQDTEIAIPEYYLPSAIFICSNARWQLYSAARLVRDDFIYSDTDSIKVTSHGNEILQNSPEFFVDPLKLGAWGYEGRYETARFVRQKTYSYEQVDKHGELQRHYTVCGAPDSVKLAMKIDDFKPGMIITLEQLHREGREGRLLPVRVPGGVILEETGFQINTVENWDEASGLNMPINYELFCDIIKKKNEEGKGLENG